MVGLHHFTTVGRYARVGSQTPVRRDVPPYTVFGYREDDSVPAVQGIHTEGIEAADLTVEERRELERALSDLFSDETALQTKIEQIVNLGVEGEVASLCEFCQRSLAGVYGRHRERERGTIPPEALEWLTPAERAWFRRNQE
jgi:UDP-N-acetylglucosamine acyltransferase